MKTKKESSDLIELFKRYAKNLVKFGFVASKTEVVNIFSKILNDDNYWPYPQTTIKQTGYGSRFIPLINAYCMIPCKCVFISLFTNC